MTAITTVVKIGRDSFDMKIDRTTPVGNPFVLGRDGNRATVIQKHDAMWRGWLADETQKPSALAWLYHMRGHTLGCHCKPLACHGDNYVQLIAEFC